MSRDTPSQDLTTDNHPAPEPPPCDGPATAGAQTLQAAPGAVKRSMPMALSIMLGILLAAMAAWFFHTIVWFILLLYLSFVAATVLEAPVGWLSKRGLRRGFAATLVMLGGLLLFLGILTLLANGLYSQGVTLSSQLQKAPERINQFVNDFGHHFPGIGDHLKNFDVADTVAQGLPSFYTVWTNALAGVVFVSSLAVAFFITLYMLMDGPAHLKAARCLLPKSSRLEATRVFNDIVQAHRGWALASLLNVLSAATLVTLGLFFMGVPGALILGIVAGLGELIPSVGPFFGSLPALLFALLASPERFLYVVAMFAVVWTLQSYTLSPLVMRFSVKLPVLITIISVLIMAELFGLLGILAAIPLVTDMVVLWNFVSAKREQDTTDYDCANRPANGTRDPVATGAPRPSNFRGLFRHSRSNPPEPAAQPSAAPDAAPHRLEPAERRPADR